MNENKKENYCEKIERSNDTIEKTDEEKVSLCLVGNLLGKDFNCLWVFKGSLRLVGFLKELSGDGRPVFVQERGGGLCWRLFYNLLVRGVLLMYSLCVICTMFLFALV